jgi:hypothetical protein
MNFPAPYEDDWQLDSSDSFFGAQFWPWSQHIEGWDQASAFNSLILTVIDLS